MLDSSYLMCLGNLILDLLELVYILPDQSSVICVFIIRNLPCSYTAKLCTGIDFYGNRWSQDPTRA